MNVMSASTSVRKSGPPRCVAQADMVVPVRPFAIALRKNSSLTLAKKSACVRAGAWSALYPAPVGPWQTAHMFR
jgi:hypothetical protein